MLAGCALSLRPFCTENAKFGKLNVRAIVARERTAPQT